jgi:hypothetical protein
MITVLKLAGVSAALSAGLVAGLDGAAPAGPGPSAKVYYDRVGDYPATLKLSTTGLDGLLEAPRVVRATKSDRFDRAVRADTASRPLAAATLSLR